MIDRKMSPTVKPAPWPNASDSECSTRMPITRLTIGMRNSTIHQTGFPVILRRTTMFQIAEDAVVREPGDEVADETTQVDARAGRAGGRGGGESR